METTEVLNKSKPTINLSYLDLQQMEDHLETTEELNKSKPPMNLPYLDLPQMEDAFQGQ